MQEVLAQVFGALGVLAFILSYQIKSNRLLFAFQFMGCAMFCAQFFLLDALSGCLSLAVTMLRNVLMMKSKDWTWVRWKGWPAVFGGAFFAILLLTWAGPVSLLAFTASTVSTIGYWTNNAQKIRLANLACASPCWLVYDVIVGSWSGVLNEAITLGSILVSIYRYGWKAMGDPDSEFQK